MNAQLKKSLSELEVASMLIFELYRQEAEQQGVAGSSQSEIAMRKSTIWLHSPNAYLFGDIPQECLISGRGSELINFLKAKLGHADAEPV